jgi:hypothetical protein
MAMEGASRLAGPPVRTSRPFARDGATESTAFLKLRLGHSANGSVLVPEQLFVEHRGWWFYQTSFFGPPMLGFDVEPGLNVARFNLDIGDPRTIDPTRVIATIRSDELVRRYDDGAQLYRCSIDSHASFADHPSGRARPLPNSDFALELFHITNATAAESIARSGEIWSSAWNLQGTRKLTNVAYVYLTSLPEVRDEEDLRRIAMASDGVIHFQTTSAGHREKVLAMTVYRETTTGRTQSLPVAVPTTLIAPPHLLLHRPAGDAYYEVVGPEIYRVGVMPGVSLAYLGGDVQINAASLKRFSYIVVGDAAELDGLAAPYDEEETQHVMHLETLDRHDLFEFWRENANSDQMTERSFEPRTLG